MLLLRCVTSCLHHAEFPWIEAACLKLCITAKEGSGLPDLQQSRYTTQQSQWRYKYRLSPNSGAASSKGPGLCSLSKASPSERPSKAASAVAKWDGWAFPGCITRCSRLYPYPYRIRDTLIIPGEIKLWKLWKLITSRFLLPRPAKVTIYATRCRHFLSFFHFFFSDAQKILRYRRPRKIVAVHPQKEGKEGHICGVHLEEPSNGDSLRTVLWTNWPSNMPFEGRSPWIGI